MPIRDAGVGVLCGHIWNLQIVSLPIGRIPLLWRAQFHQLGELRS